MTVEINEDSNFVRHARRELELIGEDQDVIDWYLQVLTVFTSYGHSGGSASVAIPVLHELLQFHNLTPLTDDPSEWVEVGYDVWQNSRRGEAFSSDGGKTYWLLGERDAAGSIEVTPLHTSEEKQHA